MKNKDDNYYMSLALKEASKAYLEDEVPVGAVLVVGDKVIAKAHNERQKKHDVLGHAEVKVIQKASKKLNAWILDNATLYVTLFPCNECAKLIIQSGIKEIVYVSDKYNGSNDNVASKRMLAAAGVKCRQMENVEVIIKTDDSIY